MTATREDAPETADPSPEEPEGAVGVRTARRRQRERAKRRRVAFAVTIGLLAVSIPVLGYIGVQALLDSRGGRLVQATLAPDEPGYEAIVEPTPTALVVQLDQGRLSGLTVLSLTSPDGGGAVLFVPIETLTDPSTQAYGFDRLRTAYELTGLDGVRNALGLTLNMSFSDAAQVDAAQLATLVGPTAPLRFENPDDLRGEDANGERIRFEGGPIELPADQVGQYLALRPEGESDLNRMIRHQLVWQAWLGAVAAAPDPAAAVPGEGGSGLGHFIRRLAAGPVVYETLPVSEVTAADGSTAFQPATGELPDLVARLVPLPTAASPGSRVRVRILDGAQNPAAVQDVIRTLVPAAAQIVVVGNADRFTYAATEVRYDPQAGEAALRLNHFLNEALGVGEPRAMSFGTDAFDVTVVIGRDLAPTTEQGAETTD
jgi:hypothetical protein